MKVLKLKIIMKKANFIYIKYKEKNGIQRNNKNNLKFLENILPKI